jgi:hypothetical protein
MYRPEWFPRDRGVCQIACDVVSTIRGGMERSAEAQGDDIKALEYLVENWHVSRDSIDEGFDSAVFKLVQVALDFNRFHLRM